jgi:hypothetical protein
MELALACTRGRAADFDHVERMRAAAELQHGAFAVIAAFPRRLRVGMLCFPGVRKVYRGEGDGWLG